MNKIDLYTLEVIAVIAALFLIKAFIDFISGIRIMRKIVLKDDDGSFVDEYELKPCPFCGKNKATLFNTEVIIDDGDEEDIDIPTTYAMACPIDEGGCGASTGFFNTEQEAIEAWNKRM